MPVYSQRENGFFCFARQTALITGLCRIPAGHTAAPTLAVAEKMADLIKAEYAKI